MPWDIQLLSWRESPISHKLWAFDFFSEGTIIELKWILYSNNSFFLCNLVIVSQRSMSGFFGGFKTWHGSKRSSTLLHQKAGVHGLMGVSPFGWNSSEHWFVTAPQFEESHRLMVK